MSTLRPVKVEGRTWYVSSGLSSWEPEITIPVDTLEGVRPEQIGPMVLSLVDSARIEGLRELGNYFRINDLPSRRLNRPFALEMVASLEPHENGFIRMNEIEPNGIAAQTLDFLRRCREYLSWHPEPQPKKTQRGHIYLLGGKGYYKIGKAKNLASRVNRLVEVKLPFECELIHSFECDDYSGRELELHNRFSDKRVNGEWFRLTSDDVSYLKGLSQ